MSITEAGATVSQNSGVDQNTWTTSSFTIPAGTDCLVIGEANANGGGGVKPLSIKLDGTTALTFVPSSSIINGNFFETSLWYLKMPSSGSHTLTIDVNSDASQHSAAFWFAGMAFLTGVDQTTPVGTAVTNSDITTAGASVTASGGVLGDLYLAVGHVYGTSISSGGSQTVESKQQNIGALTSASMDSIAGNLTGAFTFTAGGTTSGGWATSAVVFKAAAVVTTVKEVENSARPRPGRGPFSSRAKGFRVASIDAYSNVGVAAALAGNAIDTAQATGDLTTTPNVAQVDWGQSRNRPGRGPLSTGRFFLPSIDAFKISASAALQGAAIDVATAAASLSTAINMAGSATDSALATANLSTAISLAVNAIASANASGALTTAIQMLGTATDNAVSTGQLTTQITLVANAIDTAIATGSLNAGALLSGAAQAVSVATGNLTTAIQLLGNAADQASAAGTLATGIKLSGNATDNSVATGALNSNAAALVGAAQSIVTALGVLLTGIQTAGNATDVAQAAGALSTAVRLLGNAQGVSTATGALNAIANYLFSAAPKNVILARQGTNRVITFGNIFRAH